MSGSRIVSHLATAVFAATVLVSIPLVLGLMAERHPALDALGHFRAHLAVLCALGGLILLTSRRWKQGLLATALGMAALWTTLGAFPIASLTAAEAGPKDRAVYRLLQLNLLANGRSLDSVVSLIGRAKPDVVVLQEMSLEWRPWIDRIATTYPYSVTCARHFGVAILSRRPFAPGTEPQCGHSGSFAVADVNFGGRLVEVAALHLQWPWPYDQAAQLDALRPTLAALGPTALVGGDLNAATWSAAMRRIEAGGGLTHVTGIGPTWLDRRLPDALRQYVGLPIDQVLAKGDVRVISARTLEAVGSDHLPVLVEFSLTGEQNAAMPGDS
jgi:endonuclease/exonuclease/phosphatase (EEP) superfamily protein YafD